MSVTFLHTADWQLGKPFAGVADVSKRSLLQNERLAAIQRIGALALARRAEFILVAGDLFDSPSATKATVSAACSAIGSCGIPVLAIPGNHDHGGPGSLWEQDFFQREREHLAPNLRILLKAEPVEVAGAVVFPCPLLRRHETADPSAWLRSVTGLEARFGDRPRIVLAHGSVVNFGPLPDDEEVDAGGHNFLELERLPEGAFDYLALGDWHGTKQIDPRTWYSGTPELDRFVKGDAHNPGNTLVVEAARGRLPQVQCVRTGELQWHELAFCFEDDAGLDRLQAQVAEKIGQRANRDLLWLHLTGTLGIAASTRLEQWMETWGARLLRVKHDNQTSLAPSASELDALTQRTGDPLLARVASRLVSLATGAGENAATARVALRELHAAVSTR